MWWLTPTHPELKTNYYERVWPKREIKQMYRTNNFDVQEEEDSDPEKKFFIADQKRAQFEKKLFWLTILAFIFLWIFVLQDIFIEQGIAHYNWRDIGLPEPEQPKGRSKWKV